MLDGEIKQTEKEAIERVSDFLNTVRALKKLAHRLKPANTG